jgi:hypothetical protein
MKCKLESKSKALVILSQDLVEVKRERDEYKLMAEQIRDRYHGLKKMVKDFQPNIKGVHGFSLSHPLLSTHMSLVEQIASNTPLANVLLELTEQNKYLLFEVEELKTKLFDAEGDLKLMREQLRSQYQGDVSFAPTSSCHRAVSFNDSGLESPNHPRNSRTMQEVVDQLETFRNRVTLMERDLQVILDEKEELILSRDSYKRKSDRLNRKLNDLLRRPSGETKTTPTPIDIDSMERENGFLRDKLRQMEEENKLNTFMLSKYKVLLEKSQSNKRNLLLSLGLSSGSTSPKGSSQQDNTRVYESVMESSSNRMNSSLFSTNVVSSKQIQQFIASNGLNHLEVSSASITHLRNLILALFEALCDKSSALTLHRKNNKLLGKRITELEDKLRQLTTEKVLMLTKSDDVFPRTLGVIDSVDEPDTSEQLNDDDEDTATESDAGQEIAIPAELNEDDPDEFDSDVSSMKLHETNE